MKKLLMLLTSLLILVLSSYSYGQSFTIVTATLVDSSAQIWTNATVIVSLRPAPNNPGAPLNQGHTILDSPQTTVTDNTGTFSVIIDDTSKITPAGALWTFCIYPNATVVNGNCISLAITGSSLSLSGILSSILTVPTVFAAPAVNRAYSISEVNGGSGGIFWDTSANVLRGCAIMSGVCTWVVIGAIGAPGSQGYIPFNNGSGGFTASINLQFNNSTNTLSVLNELVSGTLTTNGIVNTGTITNTGTLTNTAHIQTNNGTAPGGAPTCSVTGAGTGAVCALSNGSTDSIGQILITAGTTPSSSGTVTLTFNTSFSSGHSSICIPTPAGVNWATGATADVNSFTPSSSIINWSDNGSLLVNSMSYGINYICAGI